MVISLRKCLRLLRYFIAFILLTFMMYKGLGLFSQFLYPLDKYRLPDGSAIRAFWADNDQSQKNGVVHQLLLFYWYGE